MRHSSNLPLDSAGSRGGGRPPGNGDEIINEDSKRDGQQHPVDDQDVSEDEEDVAGDEYTDLHQHTEGKMVPMGLPLLCLSSCRCSFVAVVAASAAFLGCLF